MNCTKIASKFLHIAFMSLLSLTAHGTMDTLKCEEFRKNLPAHMTSGFLEVPLDWSGQKEGSLKLFYFGHVQPGATNVIYINGGPAFSGELVWNFKMKAFSQRWEKEMGRPLNFVFFNQRGTGCAGEFPKAIEDFRFYNSDSIAKDVEALRVHLMSQSKKTIVWGQSYGTVVAMKYYKEFGSRVDRVIATGPVVPKEYSSEMMPERIVKQAQVLEDYFRDYPQDRRLLQHLVNEIPRDFCIHMRDYYLCGRDTLHILAIFHLSKKKGEASWEGLHRFLAENIVVGKAISAPALAQLRKELAHYSDIINTSGNGNEAIGFMDITYANHDELLARIDHAMAKSGLKPLISEGEILRAELRDNGKRAIKESMYILKDTTNKVSDLLKFFDKERPSTPLDIFVGSMDQMTPPIVAGKFVADLKTSVSHPIPVSFTVVPGEGHALDIHLPTVKSVFESCQKALE